MCQNNPQVEKITIWGFTEEEIEHRWKVHFKFDPLNRLFGGEDSKSSRQEAPKINNENMMGVLESFLSEGNSDG